MAFCDQCGHELSDSARFCPSCGAARDVAAEVPPAAPPEPAVPPETPVPAVERLDGCDEL